MSDVCYSAERMELRRREVTAGSQAPFRRLSGTLGRRQKSQPNQSQPFKRHYRVSHLSTVQ